MEHLTPGIPVVLGEHEYRVVAQRQAYLRRKLAEMFGGLRNLEDLDADSPDELIGAFSDQVYELLSILIPDLMPRHEFEGFASADAMERDDYKEDFDRSPTPPEIKDAITAAMRVNGFDWLGKIKDWIGGDFLRAQFRVKLAEWASQTPTSGPPVSKETGSSQSLPQPSGESPSTPSTTPDRTPEPVAS